MADSADQRKLVEELERAVQLLDTAYQSKIKKLKERIRVLESTKKVAVSGRIIQGKRESKLGDSLQSPQQPSTPTPSGSPHPAAPAPVLLSPSPRAPALEAASSPALDGVGSPTPAMLSSSADRKIVLNVRTKLSEAGAKLEEIEVKHKRDTLLQSLSKVDEQKRDLQRLGVYHELYKDLLNICAEGWRGGERTFSDSNLSVDSLASPSSPLPMVAPPPPPPPPPKLATIYKPQRWHKIRHSTLDAVTKLVRGLKANALRIALIDMSPSQEQAHAIASAFQECESVQELKFDASLDISAAQILTLLEGAYLGKSIEVVSFSGLHLEPHVFPPLAKMMPRLQSCVMEHCTNALELADLVAAIGESSSLRVLSLSGNVLGGAQFALLAGALARNSSVVLLKLSNCALTDEDVEQLAPLLEQRGLLLCLDISENKIGSQGAIRLAEALKRNASLETINMSFNPIGPTGGAALAQALHINTTVQILQLSEVGLGPEGGREMADMVAKTHTLTELRLWGNQLGDEPMQVFSRSLCANTSLAVLDLRGNELTRRGLCLFEGLSQNTTLEHLDLGGNPQIGSSLLELGQAMRKAVPHFALKRLDLDGNNHGDQGLRALAPALQGNTSLTHLDLQLNGLGDTGMLYLSSTLDKNPYINTLDLSWNHIGTAGARAFAERIIRKSPTSLCSINVLNLEGNNLGTDGIISICSAMLHNTSITSINLSGNALRHEGTMAVARLLEGTVTLKKIWLRNNGIKDPAAVAIAAALKRNQSIDDIDVAENSIGLSGTAALSEAICLNNTIKNLDLSENPIGREGREMIRVAQLRNPIIEVILDSPQSA